MAVRDTVEMLRGARIFEALSKKEIGAVARVSREVQHNAGDEIVREGTPGVGFHLILAGRVRVTKKGRKLRELGPGDSFGDISIVDGGPRTASVVAETPLRLLSILAWEFKPLLLDNPHLAYKMLLRICELLRDAEARPPV